MIGFKMAAKYNAENIGFFTKRLIVVVLISGCCFIAGMLGAPIEKFLFIGNGVAFGISVLLLLVPKLSIWFLNKFHS